MTPPNRKHFHMRAFLRKGARRWVHSFLYEEVTAIWASTLAKMHLQQQAVGIWGVVRVHSTSPEAAQAGPISRE
jgi:hypothetical protein